MVLYKGFGHAYIDNIGVYPQSEDCIDEMANFVREHCEKTLRTGENSLFSFELK